MSDKRLLQIDNHNRLLIYLQSLSLGNLKAIGDDARVESFGNVSVCLLQQLSHQQHDGSCAISANIVLRSRRSSNHNSSRVLDLHFSQEDVPVLGELDLFEGIDC